MSNSETPFLNLLSFPLKWLEFISRNFENFENKADAFNTNCTRGLLLSEANSVLVFRFYRDI